MTDEVRILICQVWNGDTRFGMVAASCEFCGRVIAANDDLARTEDHGGYVFACEVCFPEELQRMATHCHIAGERVPIGQAEAALTQMLRNKMD